MHTKQTFYQLCCIPSPFLLYLICLFRIRNSPLGTIFPTAHQFWNVDLLFLFDFAGMYVYVCAVHSCMHACVSVYSAMCACVLGARVCVWMDGFMLYMHVFTHVYCIFTHVCVMWVCIFVLHISVCTYTHIYVSISMCGGQRAVLAVFFKHF